MLFQKSYDIMVTYAGRKVHCNKLNVSIKYNKIRSDKMAGKNILIVDDAAFMRMMIKDILSKNGFTVVGEAENGVKAVEKFSDLNPDLVIMDITMPEMDGIEAVKAIKGIDASANIIMCSAMGQQAMVIESIQAGAKDFIVKPFQAERVIEAVSKVTG